jgi:uncharacterized protein (TIGR02145 family)
MYYARSYAKNSNGVVVYGNEVSFTTSVSLPGVRCPGTPSVTDIDGNLYHTVQIGNQCWLQSNLKTSKYRNGDNIPTGLSNSAWETTTNGACAIYNNDPVNDGLYGKLYNWYTVSDSRGLCPSGWHVPTDKEWNELILYFDPFTDTAGNWTAVQSNIAGGLLKSTGLWAPPNTGASNYSGFSSIPAGHRAYNGTYYASLGERNHLWSSSMSPNGNPWVRSMWYDNNGIYRANNDHPNGGFSVRCLKNTLPQVNTTSVTNITPSTALVTGEVITDGGDQNTTRGFCYSTTSNPTVSNDTTINGNGPGVYSDTLQNLTPSTTYYVRAYSTNSLGTSYGNELSFTTSPLAIGSNYAGGIVFYLDSTGQHGLVCAPSDQGVAEWGCYLGSVGTSTVLGTGNTNTLAILNSCTQRPIAASLCADLILNGYDDWYLPSRDELNLICQRIGSIANFVGSPSWSRYWSSSQALTAWVQSDAWYVEIYLCQVDFRGKDNPYRVRAIRSF